MNDEELAAEFERVRADLAERTSKTLERQHYYSVWQLQMRAAWLLIALGRYDEAITSAGEAYRIRQLEWPGQVLWVACEAQAVAHLARGEWSKAENAARLALQNWGEEESNYRLCELALQAQGRLHPDRVWKVCKDAARDLAQFDAKSYALNHISVSRD